MTAEELGLCLVAAGISGIKSLYGIAFWTGKETSLLTIGKDKRLYGFSAIWFFTYLGLQYGLEQSIVVLRIVDLGYTYVLLSMVDIRRRIVPNEILTAYFIGQIVLGIAGTSWITILQVIFTGTVFTLLVFAFAWISGKKMGMGDIKLLGVTAMTAGWKYTLQTLMWGMGLSFLYSVGLLLIARKNIRTEFPFVPFLAAGIGIQMLR